MQTIERISRGHFRLEIIRHGEGGRNREVQVIDTVEGFLVKGVTEQAVIAHILLDARTAAKHFESIKASKDLEREMKRRDGSMTTGLEKVLQANKKLTKPKSARKAWPKLRKSRTAEEIQAEGERLEEAARLAEAEVVEEVVEEVREVVTDDVDPIDLATIWEFEDDDAKGLFLGIATAFGSAEVEAYLAENTPEGEMTADFIEKMGSDLSDAHVSGSVVEVIDEKAVKGKKARTFAPKKGS